MDDGALVQRMAPPRRAQVLFHPAGPMLGFEQQAPGATTARAALPGALPGAGIRVFDQG